MVGLVETVERRAVDAKQRRLPVCVRQPVEIDQEGHHAIAEAVTDRLQPRMHDAADVKRGSLGSDGFPRFDWPCAHDYSAASASSCGGSRHGATAPSASATARPDRNPSSWNP